MPGAYAANLLGLSDQVPMRVVFLPMAPFVSSDWAATDPLEADDAAQQDLDAGHRKGRERAGESSPVTARLCRRRAGSTATRLPRSRKSRGVRTQPIPLDLVHLSIFESIESFCFFPAILKEKLGNVYFKIKALPEGVEGVRRLAGTPRRR